MYSADLADLWSARRWRRLLSLIDGLGRTSRYVEAVASDVDAARARAKRRPTTETAKRVPPRLTEFGPTEELLATAVDRLGELLAVMIAANSKSGKGPRIPRTDRPVTADVLVARELRDAANDAIVALWLPRSAEVEGEPTTTS